MSKKKLLLFSLSNLLHVARLPKCFSDAGFEVATLCYKVDTLQYSQCISARYYLEGSQSNLALLNAFLEVFKSYKADYVVFADQQSVEIGHIIYKMLQHPSIVLGSEMQQVFGLSLGSPDFFETIKSKYKSSELMASLGKRTLQQEIISKEKDVLDFADSYDYPVIIKSGLAGAGNDNWVCHSDAEVSAVLAGQSFDDLFVQKYMPGKVIMYAALVLNGVVINNITYMQEQAYPTEVGESSVVKVVSHKTVSLCSQEFIAEIKFSGFICLEYLIEDYNREVSFLTCKPWPVPVTALSHLVGVNLFKPLLDSLNEKLAIDLGKSAIGRCIALFPQEWQRDINSPYLLHAIHDVPWSEPLLLKKYMDYILSQEP